MKIIEKFVSDDGKIFDSAEECLKYEETQESLIKNTKFYKSFTTPDLTEGRGFYNAVYFAVTRDMSIYKHRMLSYLFNTYGDPIAFVMGVQATEAWTIPKEITKEEFIAGLPAKCGDYTHKSKKLVITSSRGNEYMPNIMKDAEIIIMEH